MECQSNVHGRDHGRAKHGQAGRVLSPWVEVGPTSDLLQARGYRARRIVGIEGCGERRHG